MRVLTIGTFDLLHFGHVDFLRKAAELGELTVGVNSDDFAASYKRRPIMSQGERCYAVSQLGYQIRVNTSPGRDLIERIKPDVLAEGTDWAPATGRDWFAQIDVDQEWLDLHGVIVAWIPYVQHLQISTSAILSRIRDQS